ncbi:hypothetical protein CC2G_014215 [Coprinopsis cinerea AmutBmut pab1-1]|nr:hypothetical protein CC2G_014215 [Coprinopsis cinerea AmutBmut pab1-1]
MPPFDRAQTIGFSFGYSVAILTSIVRLVHRLKRRQIWWDDFWSFIALLLAAYNLIVALLLNLPDSAEETYTVVESSFLLYSVYQLHPAIIWASRLSILVTVVRFLSPGRNRVVSFWSAVVLFVMWLAVAISAIFYCGYPLMTIPGGDDCVYQMWPTAVALSCNVTATIWLVGWPIYLFTRIKLARPGRNLIVACFSTGLLLGALDIFHAANLLTLNQKIINVSGHLEVMVALVLCNLLVLVAYIYRVFRGPNGSGETSDDSTGASYSADLSRSKTEDDSRPRRTRTSGALVLTEDIESSIGPLTTVYTSTGDFSLGSIAHTSPQQSKVSSYTSPLNSLVSKENDSFASQNRTTDEK